MLFLFYRGEKYERLRERLKVKLEDEREAP